MSETDKLGALALTEKDRRDSYQKAIESFTAKLNVTPPETSPPDFSDKCFERVLLIHMMALIVVDKKPALDDKALSYSVKNSVAKMDKEETSVQRINSILDCILNREKQFWRDQIAIRQLSHTLYNGFYLLMCVISGQGGIEQRKEAITTIERVKLFHGQPHATLEAIADLLHSNYPGKMWIEPIAPDLLKERLVVKAMKENRDAFLEFFM